MNLFIKQKQTHRHGKQTYGYQRGKGGGINQETGINMYTLLYIKQITNKDLLYSTGKYTQYYVITSNGKESEKEWGYMYVVMRITTNWKQSKFLMNRTEKKNCGILAQWTFVVLRK